MISLLPVSAVVRPEECSRPLADLPTKELDKRLGRNWDFQQSWTDEVAGLYRQPGHIPSCAAAAQACPLTRTRRR